MRTLWGVEYCEACNIFWERDENSCLLFGEVILCDALDEPRPIPARQSTGPRSRL